MLAAGNIFKCYESHEETAGQVSSVLAALLLMRNGFAIDCLMLRYQGMYSRSLGLLFGRPPEPGGFIKPHCVLMQISHAKQGK